MCEVTLNNKVERNYKELKFHLKNLKIFRMLWSYLFIYSYRI